MESRNMRPLIVAHRGASAHAPENTLAAIRRAVNDGAEGIEFDVRITREQIPVVFHDPDLKRIEGSADRIEELTLDELASVDVGRWFEKKNSAETTYAGEGIPTLASVLELLSDFPGPVYVEIKSGQRPSDRLSKAVAEVLRPYSGKLHLIVKSFDFSVVKSARNISPGFEAAALFEPKMIRLLQQERQLVEMARSSGFDRLSVHHSMVTRELMEKAEKAGLPVSAWTVDSPRRLKRMTALAVDTVITNDPGLLLAERDKQPRGVEADALRSG